MIPPQIEGKGLSAIYSCKLFQSSPRKTKIRAALEDPVNAELVKQLTDYLDDEYLPKKPAPQKQTETKTSKTNSESSDGQEFEHEDYTPRLSPAQSAGPKLSEKYGDALDAEGAAKFDAVQISEESSESVDTDNRTAESSVTVQKAPISADTIVTAPFVENHVSLAGITGEIKGTLNARNETQGVIRTSVKNDELWIYYRDDINLNHVMSAVIDIITAANYSYLIFNRLARTDNAIVFTINSNDTGIGNNEK